MSIMLMELSGGSTGVSNIRIAVKKIYIGVSNEENATTGISETYPPNLKYQRNETMKIKKCFIQILYKN